VDVYERLASAPTLAKVTEAYLWAKSLNCYSDSDATVRYLAKASLSNGRYDGPVNVAGFPIWQNHTINRILTSTILEIK
jgi:hypothetical protein